LPSKIVVHCGSHVGSASAGDPAKSSAGPIHPCGKGAQTWFTPHETSPAMPVVPSALAAASAAGLASVGPSAVGPAESPPSPSELSADGPVAPESPDCAASLGPESLDCAAVFPPV
jgi:hypothetical protein